MLPNKELIEKFIANQNELYITAIALIIEKVELETYLNALVQYIKRYPNHTDKIYKLAKATILLIEKMKEAETHGENQQDNRQ